MTPMRRRRFHLAAVVLEGAIFALGGHEAPSFVSTALYALSIYGEASSPLSSVERYDRWHWRWEEVTPMGRNREAFAAVVLDGRIYALGGSGGRGAACLSSAERAGWLAGLGS